MTNQDYIDSIKMDKFTQNLLRLAYLKGCLDTRQGYWDDRKLERGITDVIGFTGSIRMEWNEEDIERLEKRLVPEIDSTKTIKYE